jgi:probable lipoprotein NlpC
MVDTESLKRMEREQKAPTARLAPPLAGESPRPVYAGYIGALHGAVNTWIGTPYLFGGIDHQGIDCSAFVRAVFRQAVNMELPRNSGEQYLLGQTIQQPFLAAGDLVFFDTLDRGRVTHVAVYLGSDEIAHASSSKGVTRTDLRSKYFQRAYVGSKRILEP